MNPDVEAALRADGELAAMLVRLLGTDLLPVAVGLEGVSDPANRLVEGANRDTGLEAVVERLGRPSLLVVDDLYDAAADDALAWNIRLQAAKQALRSASAATGRVAIRGIAASIGTAWMVEGSIAVTNRHVASLFSRVRNGVVEISKDANGQSYQVFVDFGVEGNTGTPTTETAALAAVLYVTPERDGEPDVAFIELTGTNLPPPPPLGASVIASRELVAAIGHPSLRESDADITRIFAGPSDVKRLAPGWIKDIGPDRFTHDCSTLRGNSGSLIMSLQRRTVVGLHFGGQRGVANHAVRIHTVQRHLERAKGRHPTLVPTTSGLVDSDALAARPGYAAADFLAANVTVPLPTIIRNDTVLSIDGSTELRYQHHSAFVHTSRRLAVLTAANFDGTSAPGSKESIPAWTADPRVDTGMQCGADFFEGHLVDRMPLVAGRGVAWGDSAAEADDARQDTYFETNCVPVGDDLRRSPFWQIERDVCDRPTIDGYRLCAFAGPILRVDDPDHRGSPKLPQAFWKVIVAVRRSEQPIPVPILAVAGLVLAQVATVTGHGIPDGPFELFQLSLARLERMAQVTFGLSDHDRLLATGEPYRSIRDASEITF